MPYFKFLKGLAPEKLTSAYMVGIDIWSCVDAALGYI